jgi:hypothetical protein
MECPVCNSKEHIHCSRGCELCDDQKNPHPTFAEKFCHGCRRSLCSVCWDDHECSGGLNKESPDPDDPHPGFVPEEFEETVSR